DFAEKKYIVKEIYGNKERIVYSCDGELPIDSQFSMRAEYEDNAVSLYVNDVQKLYTDDLQYIGFGRTGIISDRIQTAIYNYSYSGEGRPVAGIYDTTIPDIMNIDMVQLDSDELLYLGAYGKTAVSSDNGFTWEKGVDFPYSANTKAGNIIRLNSGKLLMITRYQYSTTQFQSHAYVSSDEGKTWEGPYPIEKNILSRITMNGKMDQMQDGRIFYATSNLGEGIEEHSIVSVYYSDDEGKTWNKSENDINSFKNFYNLQECKVTETDEANHVILYGRTEYGFIYCCDSYDNGVTWEEEMRPTQLAAPMNAFNIRRDPYSGNYYAFWTYDNKNDYGNKQFPRLKTALAVSSDNQKTWEYVMDVDEFDYGTTNFNRFQNLSIDFAKDAIYLNFIRNVPTESSDNAITTRVVRIDRNKIMTTKKFPYLHVRVKDKVPFVINSVAESSLFIPLNSRICFINNHKYVFDKMVYTSDGKILTTALEKYLGVEIGSEEYFSAEKIAEMYEKNISTTDAYFMISECNDQEKINACIKYLQPSFANN
ncbi:MAG: sialidase family protein, partial [Firmicutes bacterium]|nr:sialidase family protein [Bacillota bacterium]